MNNRFLLFGPAGAWATPASYLRSVCNDEFLSFTQNMFSQIETYKITDGKIEPGVKGYEHGHAGFTIRSALLMVDADFCR